MVRLKLMPPLTRILGSKEILVEVDRAPLKAILERVAARDGKFRAAMLDAEGNLSGEYSCLVNGRRYNAGDLHGVEVGEADEIVLLMPIAGGKDAAMPIEVLVTTHVTGLDREREEGWPLPLPGAAIRLRDLIRAKVTREIEEYVAGRRGIVGKEYQMLDELAAFQVAARSGRPMDVQLDEQVRKAWKAV